MNFKIPLILIFLASYGALVTQATGTLDCSYIDGWYSIAYRKLNFTYYECDLSTKKSSYNQIPTYIEGQHISGRTDSDTQFIYIKDGNLLQTLSSIFCKKFQNLAVLFTVNVQIASVDSDALSNCPNLKSLDLNGNKFQTLPEYLLIQNPKMTRIRIADGLLTTLPENFFLNQRELEELDIRNNQIDFLPSRIFNSVTNLQHLFIKGNKFRSLDPTWFLKVPKLKQIGANTNEITEVPSRIFKQLKNLDELYLNENDIKVLHSDSFDGLSSLSFLNLDYNEIAELPPNVFVPLRNIQNLTISHNKLTIVHSDSFGTHDKIDWLWMKGNRINAVDEKLLSDKHFTYFDFDDNNCASFYTWTSSEIKQKIKNCFQNYQPRYQSLPFVQQHILTSFTSQSTDSSCGRPVAAQGNIIGGTKISRGAFPWIGAMVKPNGKFFCGCTLVSNRKAITAAHCIQPKESGTPTLPRDMLVLLGIHDLDNSVENGRLSSAVKSIHMHDDWNPFTESFDADIAVLVLDSPVTFSKNIQPICLIPTGSNIVTISQSIVVGFGQSENPTKIHENIAKILDNPIHSTQKCFQLSPALKKIASGRTFCAGQGRGQGVCRGDSGSGVFVSQGGTYYMRGIVSSSIIGGPYGCDVDNYAIFTDVVKFYNWINSIPVDGNAAERRKK